MKELKQVSREEFENFLHNYKGKITPHRWNEVTQYHDFDLPSENPIGSAKRLDDTLIARKDEPFWDVPNKYYILK